MALEALAWPGQYAHVGYTANIRDSLHLARARQ